MRQSNVFASTGISTFVARGGHEFHVIFLRNRVGHLLEGVLASISVPLSAAFRHKKRDKICTLLKPLSSGYLSCQNIVHHRLGALQQSMEDRIDQRVPSTTPVYCLFVSDDTVLRLQGCTWKVMIFVCRKYRDSFILSFLVSASVKTIFVEWFEVEMRGATTSDEKD